MQQCKFASWRISFQKKDTVDKLAILAAILLGKFKPALTVLFVFFFFFGSLNPIPKQASSADCEQMHLISSSCSLGEPA